MLEETDHKETTRPRSQLEIQPRDHSKCTLLLHDQGNQTTPLGTGASVMEKLGELMLKEKNERAGTDVSGKSTELEQNGVTEQGNPQGWPAATGTSYMLWTETLETSVPFRSHPPMAGEGWTGADGARGVEWAAGPWLVSIT